MPAPHRSVFTGRMPFLSPNQQRQSTEGNNHIATPPKQNRATIIGNVIRRLGYYFRKSLADRQTDTQTDTLIAILRFFIGGGVTELVVRFTR